MNEFERRVTLLPDHARGAKPEIIQWLDTVNAQLGTQGVTTELAKGLIINRNVLYVPEDVMEQVRQILAAHYGLLNEDQSELGKLQHRLDLAAATNYERFKVDPFLAIQEYQQTPWKKALAPFSGYGNSGIRFCTFADAVKAAVVRKKGKELAIDAVQRTQRIANMTPEEWNNYRAGIRWSQSAHAQDVLRESLEIAERVIGTTNFVRHLYFIKKACWEEALGFFLSFSSSQLLDRNSGLEIRPTDFLAGDLMGGGRRHLSTDLLLTPKT